MTLNDDNIFVCAGYLILTRLFSFIFLLTVSLFAFFSHHLAVFIFRHHYIMSTQASPPSYSPTSSLHSQTSSRKQFLLLSHSFTFLSSKFVSDLVTIITEDDRSFVNIWGASSSRSSDFDANYPRSFSKNFRFITRSSSRPSKPNYSRYATSIYPSRSSSRGRSWSPADYGLPPYEEEEELRKKTTVKDIAKKLVTRMFQSEKTLKEMLS